MYIFITHDTLKYYCDDFPKGGLGALCAERKTATIKQKIIHLNYFGPSKRNVIKATPQFDEKHYFNVFPKRAHPMC